MEFLIINGPNLNLLGIRQPEIYGNRNFEDYHVTLLNAFPGHSIPFFQSNHEGEIIDKLHAAGFTVDGIVLNPGGLAHTSVILRDAIEAISCPVVEVHISDIYKREPFRHQSYLTEVCVRTITGNGLEGYGEAILFLEDFARDR